MSIKRRNTSSPECETPAKRRQVETAPRSHGFDGTRDEPDNVEVCEKPQLDAYTGQAGAFPGLGQWDDDVFYGPANDGIDYLRMVRSEAKSIPSLLRSSTEHYGSLDSRRDQEDDEDQDGGYWDEDGTYTAKPQAMVGDAPTQYPKPQIAYYKSLLAQYALVRATLKCLPPLSAVEQLTSSQPISFPSENKHARAVWLQCLRTRQPCPTQLACMDQNSVLELIRLITIKMRGLFDHLDRQPVQRVGAWIWAVLGKCADRGELGSDEISNLRQLAQKAIDVRAGLEKGAVRDAPIHAAQDSDSESDAQTDTERNASVSAAIEVAKERLARTSTEQGAAPHATARQINLDFDDIEGEATSAKVLTAKFIIVDMVLTVIGEFYGQRDLLELRYVWRMNNAAAT